MHHETPWAETLHLSKSQLQTYLQCSQRYQYQYVQATPWEHLPAAMLLGRAVHQAVAFYYTRVQAGLAVSVDDLTAVFDLAWTQGKGDLPLSLARGMTEAATQAQGRALLACFVEHVRPRQIEAIEKPFLVDLADPDTGEILPVKLAGVIDLIETDDDGNVIVAELKTASRKYAGRQENHQLDGAVYGHAVQQLGLPTPAEHTLIRFDVLIKTATPQFEQYVVAKDAADLRQFLRLAAKVLRAIDLEVFVPHEGWYCTTCPFKRRCRANHRR